MSSTGDCVTIRGLNADPNHELKNLRKAAAVFAATKPGPFQKLYSAPLAKGMRTEMARLALARKIAATVKPASIARLPGGGSPPPKKPIPYEAGTNQSVSPRLVELVAGKTLCWGGGMGMLPIRSCHRYLFRTTLLAASAWLKSRFLPCFHSLVFIW